jgi:hypothetical protein
VEIKPHALFMLQLDYLQGMSTNIYWVGEEVGPIASLDTVA